MLVNKPKAVNIILRVKQNYLEKTCSFIYSPCVYVCVFCSGYVEIFNTQYIITLSGITV